MKIKRFDHKSYIEMRTVKLTEDTHQGVFIFQKKTHRKKSTCIRKCFLEVQAGFEPADNGVADRGLTTWLLHHKFGADYGARTRHLDLGKVALYQMS